MKTRCLFALVFCLPMFSQMTITGNISGSVLDQSGKAVPAARITLISRTTNELREASTNDSGTFNLVAVQPDTSRSSTPGSSHSSALGSW